MFCCLETGEMCLSVSLTSVDREVENKITSLRFMLKVFFFLFFPPRKGVGTPLPTSSDIDEGGTSGFLELVF